VGNSAIKCGLFEDERLDHTFILRHYPVDLESAIVTQVDLDRVDRVGMASVVPATRKILERLFRGRGIPVTPVHYEMPLPFELAYETPETLGADRIAAAAAAWMLFGKNDLGYERNVVAVDAGTAITCEVVRKDGVYLGGTIGAGPALIQSSLHRDTAQLPEVTLELPEQVVGRTTHEAMQSGIMIGFIEGVRGLLHRINDALGDEAFVVATGGWREILARQVPEVGATEPHLVLHGVRYLMDYGVKSQE
jgi:type III pantothenate kinase